TDRLAPNYLVLRIQPDEGIALAFNAKVPGTVFRIGGVHMDMSYREAFEAAPGTGYETLLYDCMTGDATLFQRAANIEAAWRIVQPILDTWNDTPRPVALARYPAGSAGPAEGDALIERHGDRWRDIG
ncbi:MAG: glucose-6-phosphate dehydrogenase, partial [Burkholderiales bacterium]|nr:glucose-6-phosphate dehydrogenase [Burkholderiales bacterium]